MSEALAAIRNGSCGYLKASKKYGVPKSTLERRFKEKNKYATGSSKSLGSRKLTFPIELEQQLVEYVKNMENGELSTAVIYMSASGIFVPPMLIILRVRMKPQFLEGVPPGTLTVAHKSGWMQLDLFDKWFIHFLTHIQASKTNPALLILDGHKTHTQNISIIDKARVNGVTILCLPPHCSHRLQPLDLSFLTPLSTFYSQELEIWLRNHPGRCITVSEVPSLFGRAYLRASTPINAINGFAKTGLYPINRTVCTEDMFIAMLPTDKPQQQDDIVPSSSASEDEMTLIEVLHSKLNLIEKLHPKSNLI